MTGDQDTFGRIKSALDTLGEALSEAEELNIEALPEPQLHALLELVTQCLDKLTRLENALHAQFDHVGHGE